MTPPDIPTGGYPGGNIPTGGFGGDLASVIVTGDVELIFKSPVTRALTLSSATVQRSVTLVSTVTRAVTLTGGLG